MKYTTIKIRLNSTADTGLYVTKKNARTMIKKMVVKKYDPVARKHVEYKRVKLNKKATKCGLSNKSFEKYFYSLFP